ncbi:MAG: hypothetical protein ACOYK8_04545 [Alphaproteobacteria bacterium]
MNDTEIATVQAIEAIKKRNERVEFDKAWEISLTRKCCIAAITYITCYLLMLTIGVEQPFLAALIPTTGFILSTLTLPAAKKFWLQHIHVKTKPTLHHHILVHALRPQSSAVVENDVDTGSLMAGQSVGIVKKEQSVQEIIP